VRPVILGMCQPIEGAEPLDPRPARSSGYNLWRMLADLDVSVTQDEFRRVFDRRNVLPGTQWRHTAAQRASTDVRAALRGHRAVLLGSQVPHALSLFKGIIGAWYGSDLSFEYTCVPHPSGLCRDYNHPATRRLVGEILLDLYLEYTV